MEWSYNRERCKQIIHAAGLPIPIKSACFFCPASKKAEIVWLQENHPKLLDRALRKLDKSVKAIRSLELFGSLEVVYKRDEVVEGSTTIPGVGYDGMKKGNVKAKPLVLENVRIERPDQ